MRFLADMCVDVRIVEWLRQKGHDATHLRDQGLHRMPNGDIFEKAIQEERIVITFDLDFGEIALQGAERQASSSFVSKTPEHLMCLSDYLQ